MDAYFLTGPTAVGKTAVAHEFALREGYAILSADAMLVYRGMDIGTAKPTPGQRDQVRYFGIDLADPRQSFSVADYLNAVSAELDHPPPPRRPLLVVGGTGLYLKALTQGLAEGPPPDPAQRAAWEAMAQTQGVAALQAELARRSPAWLAALPDPENPRRLIRALEWCAADVLTPPRSWQPVSTAPMVGLRMAPATLRPRIDARIRAMIRDGLWDETRRLAAVPGGMGPTALQAIGYAEGLAVLAGTLTEAAAIERIAARTRQLAKRQMTWLRHQVRVEWITLDSDTPIADTLSDVATAWKRSGPIPLALPR